MGWFNSENDLPRLNRPVVVARLLRDEWEYAACKMTSYTVDENGKSPEFKIIESDNDYYVLGMDCKWLYIDELKPPKGVGNE